MSTKSEKTPFPVVLAYGWFVTLAVGLSAYFYSLWPRVTLIVLVITLLVAITIGAIVTLILHYDHKNGAR